MRGLREKLRNNTAIYTFYMRAKNKILGDPKKHEIKEMIEYYTHRFEKYSGCFQKTETSELAYLTWLYHVIEKGLAMPNMKKGFGKERLVELLDLIEKLENEGKSNFESVKSAIATVIEYRDIHRKLNFEIDPTIGKRIDNIRIRHREINPLVHKIWSREEYWTQPIRSYTDFVSSRHSIRNFDQTSNVDICDIIKALNTAVLAPSACNRQPSRVHIIETPELIQQCIRLQNGNRGFGHLTNKLLVITGNLGTVLLPQEFFDLYTNVGIFIMNLSYSLHEQHIAHCILNWYASPEVDKKLRDLLELPAEENVVAFIICGNVPEHFKVVSSPRNKAEDMYLIH